MAPAKQRSKRKTEEEIEAERAPKDNRRGWWIGLGVGVVLFALLALLAHKHTLTGINLSIFRFINDWPNGLRLLFLAITVNSASLIIGAAAVVVTFILKLYQLAWQVAAAIIGGYIAGWLAKHFIAEPRPYKLVAHVHARATETDPSFPSGHVLVVTLVVLSLWPYLPRGWRWLAALAIPLMMLSRIYLGVHTPVDVLGGFALGLAVVSFMRILPEPLRRFLRLD